MDKEFSREMGFAREEFFSFLPAALNGRTFQRDAKGVSFELHQGTGRIDVGEQQTRKIASFALPFVKVDFKFENLSEEEFEEFMRFFDLRYQRGGG